MICTGYKTIEIEDTCKEYSVDRVNCFEKSVTVLLNHYKEFLGDCFLLLSKVAKVYGDVEIRANIRRFVVEFLSQHFYIKLQKETVSKNQIKEKIFFLLNKGMPVILIQNLKYIFYSDKYLKEDWPHLFIINGINISDKIVRIFDNTHSGDFGGVYKNFWILTDILFKTDADEDSIELLYFEKKECFEEVNIQSIYKEILQIILNNKECIFENFREIFFRADTNEDKELLITKAINFNKKRDLIIEEILKIGLEIGYREKKIDSVIVHKNKLWDLWQVFIMSNIKGNLKRQEYIFEDDDLVKEESRIVSVLKGLLNKNEIVLGLSDKRDGLDESYIYNNEDNIVSRDNNNIVFNFNTNKTYNSWEEIKSPMFSLLDDIKDYKVRIVAEYIVEPNYKESKFQIGFYVRTNSSYFFSGVDIENKIVMDKFGVKNDYIYYPFERSNMIFLDIHNNIVEFGVIKYGESEVKGRMIYDKGLKNEIGILCKTWGNGKKLKVKFYNISIKLVF